MVEETGDTRRGIPIQQAAQGILNTDVYVAESTVKAEKPGGGPTTFSTA
jgi:hypothetical protein